MNKNLKRIAALLLAIAMVASFAACKNDKQGTDCARPFLRRFLAFLKGERCGKEIIDEICNNR